MDGRIQGCIVENVPVWIGRSLTEDKIRRLSFGLTSVLALAMVSFAAGWLASEAAKADHLSRGESIGNTWESHMSALLNNQGQPAGEAKLYQSNAFSLSALTLGLAANYEDIPKEQWQRIEPHLNTVVLVAPPEIRSQTQAVVQCIQVAKQKGHLAQDCLDAARAVPWSKAAATVPN